jgi:hypothetical protein
MFAINNLRKAINTLNDHYRWNNDYNELGKVVKKHQTAGYKKVSKCIHLIFDWRVKPRTGRKRSSIFFKVWEKMSKSHQKISRQVLIFFFPRKTDSNLLLKLLKIFCQISGEFWMLTNFPMFYYIHCCSIIQLNSRNCQLNTLFQIQ